LLNPQNLPTIRAMKDDQKTSTSAAPTPSHEPSKDSPERASEAQPTPGPETGDNTRPTEIGGRRGPEPTRYGDWEKQGRCIDF